ncbi:MAG: dihydrodipicolinate reductase [Myxococcota bacterium]
MSHRVVQWSTGNVGLFSLRSLIENPDFELVGLHAHSPDKVGKDAAEIAGVAGSTGVIATDDADALIALEPDAVVYMANGEFRAPDALADMVKILSAGINIVGTSLIYLIHPPSADPALTDPLRKACAEGNSTLFVNGIDPGFSGDVLPLAALQVSGAVEEIRCQEIQDYSTYADPDFTGFSFGFGKPESFTPMIAMPGVLTGSWGGMVRLGAEMLGVEVEEIREVFDRYYATEDFECAMMPIKKGECSAVRFEVQGIVDGRPLIIAEHVNRLGNDQAPDWPMPPHGRRGVHRCIVKGDPHVQIECFSTAADGDHNNGGVHASAMRMINAIPAVCAHDPGIVTTLDLPSTPTHHVAKR